MAHNKENMMKGLELAGKPIPGMPDNPFVASNEEIEAAKEEMEEQIDIIDQVHDPVLSELESHLANMFEDARQWKEDETDIQEEIIDGYNRRKGKYSKSKQSKIEDAGSSDVFIGMTGLKCRNFESWVHDVYINSNKKRTWTLKPTPIVTIPKEERLKIAVEAMNGIVENVSPENITEEGSYKVASEMRTNYIKREYAIALKKAQAMSRLIDDQMIEGGWIKVFAEAIMDLSSSKACIIKGPIIRKRLVKKGWKKKGKKTVIDVGYEKIVTFERVSPLDLYPGRSNRNVNDGPIMEKTNISKDSLLANREEKGYIKDNIEFVCDQGGNDMLSSNLKFSEEKEDLENREHDYLKIQNHKSPDIEAIEYWCHCPGHMLPDYGITKDINGKKLDPLMNYDINCITVNGLAVYVHLNTDPLQKRPYSVFGFSKDIGSFWYQGIPELLKNEQDIANAAARSMVNNLGIASGPQVVIPDINRIPEGEDISSMYPWKIWQGTNIGGSTGPLVEFFQPDSRSNELISIMNNAIQLGNSNLELPSFGTGPEKVGTAGRTSSGLAMLLSNSNRGLKRILLGIDRYILQPTIERLYNYNMIHHEEDNIKGDMNFISEGVVSLIMKEELSDKRINLLNATQNEFDMKILGLDGRAKILSDAMEALESNYDDIKPTKEKIERLIQEEETLQQQRIQENQIKIQKEQAIIERESQLAQNEIQLEQAKLDLKMKELEIEDRNTNKELDIRRQKQTENLYSDIIRRNAKEEDNDMLSELADLKDKGVEEDANVPTEQGGETVDTQPGEAAELPSADELLGADTAGDTET